MSGLLQDIRYALRQLTRAPGFTVVALLILALGIGATTAIFTLAHALLLKSLPVAKPEELFRIGDRENCCFNSGLQRDWSLFSYNLYTTFRDHASGFSDLAAFQAGDLQAGVRFPDEAESSQSYQVEFVSGNYFNMFGIHGYLGRTLRPSDDHKSALPAAVMSFATWQKIGKNPSLIGQTVWINSHPFTLVGITPPSFFGDHMSNMPPSFWLPLADETILDGPREILDTSSIHWLNIIGRIQPGGDPNRIEAQLQLQLRQWLLSPAADLTAADRALVPRQVVHLAPGGAGVRQMQAEYQSGLELLMGTSGFVLLIACANLANLILARTASREQYTSLRTALGAPIRRLILQTMTENVTLAVIGGVLGLLVAFAGTHLILYLAFPKNPLPISAVPSLPVLGFALAISLVTGILCGAVPAWKIVHSNPAGVLRAANKSTDRHSTLLQKSLVVAQTAVSIVLLCAAGLLAQSLQYLQHQRFGFETNHRYVMHIDPQSVGQKPEELNAFYRKLRDALQQVPGVERVGFSLYSPMDGQDSSTTVYIAGQIPPPPGSTVNRCSWLRISPAYFGTIGTNLISGREFTEQDTSSSRHVAVVNQAFVRRFFGNVNPLGRHFGQIAPRYSGEYEIVGVTEDTTYSVAWRQVPPMFFLPSTQWTTYSDPSSNVLEENTHLLDTVEVQTRGNEPRLEEFLRHAVAGVDPDVTIISFQSVASQVEASFAQRNMISKLISLFGMLALVLASTGLYGVMSYLVEQNTKAIGIRMALGADRSSVLSLILRDALLQVSTGVIIGIPATLVLGHAIRNQLFGIGASDPLTLVGATLILGLAALIAALLPAYRAASIDPMQALRND